MTKTKHPDKLYYFKLFTKANRFVVDLKKHTWCDLWHQHFDCEGFGNINWVHRRRHLAALLRALTRARHELNESRKPYQLFALVHPRDSGSDAIFVHTENPNGTKFPCKLSCQPIASFPPLLAGYIDPDIYEVLTDVHENETTYVIQLRT